MSAKKRQPSNPPVKTRHPPPQGAWKKQIREMTKKINKPPRTPRSR